MTDILTDRASENTTASMESLLGEVADEFTQRLNRGEQPDIEEYAARFPQIAALLRQVLPALQLLRVAPAPDAREGIQPQGTLGDFRILREVGRGGMGVVYEAEQISLGRRVALKVLPFAGALDAKQLQRFKNEAQAAAHLHHTNIVPVHYVGCDRGVHFFAMQLIEGQTLAALINELRQIAGLGERESRQDRGSKVEDRGLQILPGPSDPLPTGYYKPEPAAAESVAKPQLGTEETAATVEDRGALIETLPALSRSSIFDSPSSFFRTVANLGIQAAEALEHAHQLGVIHRDIKPANLMVDARGNLWITDFGLAHCQGGCELTMSGDLLGTLRYMSPEQALAKRVIVDERTDIYSLGVTLYELLTLEPAFPGTDREELLRRIAFEDPKLLRRINKAIPAELQTIVLKAMEKDPADRYATAQELVDDLGRFLEDKPIWARRPTWLQRARKWERRHRAAVATGIITSFVLLVGAVSALTVSNAQITREKTQKDKALEQSRDSEQAATRRLKQSLQAVDRMLTRVAEGPIYNADHIDPAHKALFEDALEFYQRLLPESSSDPELRLETALAHARVGNIRNVFSQFTEAEEAYLGGIALAKELVAEAPHDPAYRRALAWCRRGYSACLELSGRPNREVEREVRASLELWLGLADEFPDNTDHRLHVGLCQKQLSHCLAVAGRIDDAERVIRQALATYQKLARGPSDDPFTNAVQVVEAWIDLGAYLNQRTGRSPEVERVYRNALEEAKKLKGAFPHKARGGYLVQRELGSLLCTLGQYDEARRLLAQAVAGSRQLVNDFPDVPLYLAEAGRMEMELGNFEIKWGDMYLSANKREEAAQHYQKAVAVFPSVTGYRHAETFVDIRLGDMYLSANKRAEAAQQYQKAIGVLRHVVAESREAGVRYSLAHCCKQMGWLNLTAVPPEERVEDYLHAISIYEELGQEFPKNGSCKMELAACWNHLGELRRRNGWFQPAEDALRRGLAMFQQLFDEFPQRSDLQADLARSQNNLAWILASCPNWGPEHAAEALEHAQKAVNLQPEKDDFWHTLGVAHCRLGHWKEALAAMEKSRQLEKKPGPPTSFDLFFEAMAYNGLGDKDKARRCYDEGVQWMEKHIPDHADLRRFRAEAAEMLKIQEEKSHHQQTKDTKKKASN